MLSLIAILLQSILSCVKKNNTEEYLLSLVMFLLLLKSSRVKTYNTELRIYKSIASLPKSYEKQIP